MATYAALQTEPRLRIEPICSFRHLRALAWHNDVLYASRGYTLYSGQIQSRDILWREVGRFRPSWWRNLTCHSSLAARLVRDGFHALAVLPNGNLVAAVPGAIITMRKDEREFFVTHEITRGTRPLHICVTPVGHVFWGEYFNNKERLEVYIYGSTDGGITWKKVYRFSAGQVRHIHNIVYDRWRNCLWILTGDYGMECQILRASMDFARVEQVLKGGQQARAVAAVPTHESLYFASDTPLETNYIYRLDAQDRVDKLCEIPSSSIDGCKNDCGIFFATMVEPGKVNRTRHATIFASCSGDSWSQVAQWRKDRWPMRFFQYGTPLSPSGNNSTDFLAVSTIALAGARDVQTTIYRTLLS
ncbi:MAG TPA: hypothetical protein VJO35_04030 [Terriglobales bacterium]|nr:hypothetical protein [Terriglobales bacterium]